MIVAPLLIMEVHLYVISVEHFTIDNTLYDCNTSTHKFSAFQWLTPLLLTGRSIRSVGGCSKLVLPPTPAGNYLSYTQIEGYDGTLFFTVFMCLFTLFVGNRIGLGKMQTLDDAA